MIALTTEARRRERFEFQVSSFGKASYEAELAMTRNLKLETRNGFPPIFLVNPILLL